MHRNQWRTWLPFVRSQTLFMLGGAGLLALHAAIGNPVAQASVYVLVGVAALVAVIAGTQFRKGPLSSAWRWIALSLAMWILGDASWYLAELTRGVGYPSISDGFYLAGYPLLAAGPLVLVLGGRSRREFAVDLVDATIIALGGALLVWPFVFQPTIDLGWSAATLVSLAYPAGDLVLLALLAALMFNPAKQTRSVSLLALGMLAVFIADCLRFVAEYTPGLTSEPLTLLWLVGYLLVGAAALDRQAVAGASGSRARSPVTRLLIVGTALLAIPAAIAINEASGGTFPPIPYAPIVGLIIVLVIYRGVTQVRELARSSYRLATVVETAGVGIVFRGEKLMTETNAALQEMVGYSAAELSQMNYLEMVHPDEQEHARANATVPAGTKRQLLRRLINKDGGTVHAQVTLTGTPDGLTVAVIEDLTERRQLERHLAESQKLEAVARLAGGIAHDFNNLLTAVSGHAQLLRFKENTPDDEQSIDAILQSSARAATLTQRLLSFSRTQEMAPEVIDLPSMVANAVEMLSRMIPSDIRIESRIDARSPAIFADPGEIDQMLFNFAVNARDAMPDGGQLTFEVASWTSDGHDSRFVGAPAGNYCLFTVNDNGTGMDEATCTRIFEPYFTTKEPGKGTGLGLSMIYGIVTSCGGHINVTSELGHGTAFQIAFPACARATGTAPPQLVAA